VWAIDYASSDPGEVVFVFDDLGSGLWQFGVGRQPILQFRMDDNPCTSCVASEPWKPIGPDTWDTRWLSPSGAADVVKLAAGGDSLSLVTQGATHTFERLSGGPGLAGMWRMLAERSTSRPRIELSPAVDDWFVFKSPAEGLVCVVLLDGADYRCSSPSLAPGWTMAMKITDPRALAVVVKKDGETVAESTYAVSLDDRSMTQTEKSASGSTIKTVYTRQ
jgi:hypothetical protein